MRVTDECVAEVGDGPACLLGHAGDEVDDHLADEYEQRVDDPCAWRGGKQSGEGRSTTPSTHARRRRKNGPLPLTQREFMFVYTLLSSSASRVSVPTSWTWTSEPDLARVRTPLPAPVPTSLDVSGGGTNDTGGSVSVGTCGVRGMFFSCVAARSSTLLRDLVVFRFCAERIIGAPYVSSLERLTWLFGGPCPYLALTRDNLTASCFSSSTCPIRSARLSVHNSNASYHSHSRQHRRVYRTPRSDPPPFRHRAAPVHLSLDSARTTTMASTNAYAKRDIKMPNWKKN